MAATPAAGQNAPRLPPLSPDTPFTFAVLGDNRGSDDGQQPAAFLQVLRAINDAAPSFTLNTGDMIYGRTKDTSIAREHWRLYREAIAPLKAPIFHAPGNHDIWDAQSARVYREFWGPTYYTFDHGRARFIALDTETEPGRIGAKQLEWLRRQLEQAGERQVFLFLHRPLFPVDGAIGSSLDKYPAERDRLHQLFVQHRRMIKGVFLGHEHLFHSEDRDGIPYHITGGGGANLYMPPELGGFHHFLLVRVHGDDVTVDVIKVGAPEAPLQAPTKLASAALLESWEQGLFWYAWDYTATTELTSGHASEGRSGLQLNFDLAQNPWPVLVLPLASIWDLRKMEALAIDVYLPGHLGSDFSVTPAIEGKEKHEAPAARLKHGWNTVRMNLNAPWLPNEERGAAKSLQWSLTASGGDLRGSVVFDNFRAVVGSPSGDRAPELLESWERPLLWRVADESIKAQSTAQFNTEGQRGLELNFDFSKCDRPMLFARLNPPWNLEQVAALTADLYAPDDLPAGLSISLALRSKEVEHSAPPVTLHKGWNTVRMNLNAGWLPKQVRGAAEQVEWALLSTNLTLRGWIIFDNLRAENP